jgi:hypothetical protein
LQCLKQKKKIICIYIGCLFCRLIRRLIGRHWYLPTNWRSFIWWLPDQWARQCCAIECDRSFCCALFCVFMTHVSHCPISLCAEHPVHVYICMIWNCRTACMYMFTLKMRR